MEMLFAMNNQFYGTWVTIPTFYDNHTSFWLSYSIYLLLESDFINLFKSKTFRFCNI